MEEAVSASYVGEPEFRLVPALSVASAGRRWLLTATPEKTIQMQLPRVERRQPLECTTRRSVSSQGGSSAASTHAWFITGKP